jgi:hypothetical protein
MRPTITKQKNMRGRITAHRAAIGPIEVDGRTPAEASQQCETAAVAALRRLDNGSEFLRWHGHVYAIVPTLYGWNYWIDTSESNHSQGPYPTHEEANGAALSHLAQNVWEHDVADDAAFVADLPDRVRADIAQWIRFQRAYRVHAATGKSDHESHRLACEDSYVR